MSLGQQGGKLHVSGLSLRFGGIVALNDLSFGVNRSVICGLIGPNGTGKTGLFNCISRLYNPDKGQIMFEGSDIIKAVPVLFGPRSCRRCSVAKRHPFIARRSRSWSG